MFSNLPCFVQLKVLNKIISIFKKLIQNNSTWCLPTISANIWMFNNAHYLPVLTPELAMTVASVHWSALDTEYERWCIPSMPRLLNDTKLMPLAIWDTDELLVTEPEGGSRGSLRGRKRQGSPGQVILDV